MSRFFPLIVPVTLAFIIFPVSVAHGDDMEELAATRLVEGYIREARSMTMLEPLTTGAIKASLILLKPVSYTHLTLPTKA